MPVQAYTAIVKASHGVSPVAKPPNKERRMLLNAEQVARRLQISKPTLYRWAVDPRLNFPPSVKLPGGSRRWIEYQVQVWCFYMMARDAETRAGRDPDAVTPPDFTAELPSEAQVQMMLVGQKLDEIANTQSPTPHQPAESTDDAATQPTACAGR